MGKFKVRNRRERVREANRMLKNWPQPVSLIDREAFVEFLVLEDVTNLCKHRLEALKNSDVGTGTRAGQDAKGFAIKRFEAVLELMESAKDVAYFLIVSGDYRSVWKAIPEHALQTASSNVKNLPKLCEIAIDLLVELQEAKTGAITEAKRFGSNLDDVEIHDKNTELVQNLDQLPSDAEIEEAIKIAEAIIPGTAPKKQKSAIPNLR